jgi:hypothetical protein
MLQILRQEEKLGEVFVECEFTNCQINANSSRLGVPDLYDGAFTCASTTISFTGLLNSVSATTTTSANVIVATTSSLTSTGATSTGASSTRTTSISASSTAASGGLSTGAKAGLGVGVSVAALLVIAGLVLFLLKRRKHSTSTSAAAEAPQAANYSAGFPELDSQTATNKPMTGVTPSYGFQPGIPEADGTAIQRPVTYELGS